MQVTFLSDSLYSPDCFRLERGVIGETRDVPDNAAGILIRDGAAVYAGKQQTPQEAMDEMRAEWKAKGIIGRNKQARRTA